MVLAPFLARGVQDAFGGAPIGVFPIRLVEITFEIRADLAALIEIEFARRGLGIEVLAARFERDFGGVVETIEQAPVVVIRDRAEVFPCLAQFADPFGLHRGFERIGGEFFHVGEELLALRMRCERAPVLQFLHAHGQRDEFAVNALRGAGGQTVQQPFAFAFEARGAGEVAGVDLRFEFADDVVQALQQLFVQRMTRGIELGEPRTKLVGGASSRAGRGRSAGQPIRSSVRATRSFNLSARRCSSHSASNSSGDSATGAAGTAASACVNSSA